MTMIEERIAQEMEAESVRLKAHLKLMRELEIEECTAELELEKNYYAREMLTQRIEKLRADLAASEQ